MFLLRHVENVDTAEDLSMTFRLFSGEVINSIKCVSLPISMLQSLPTKKLLKNYNFK